MHQINDFDEKFCQYLMYQINNEQTNNEQINDKQINNEQMSDEQISNEQINDEQMKMNNLNECFKFFIIELISAETKDE